MRSFLAAVALTVCSVSAQSVELAVNGGFETGDFTGWTQFPSAPGNITIGTPGFLSAFAGCIDNTVPASASLIKNANIGVGTVMPGEAITISFDARGSTAVGGVVFAEFFSEISGGGTSKNEILSGAPLGLDPDPNTWKSFSFTTTAGPDVSGGVTLQLAAITGGAAGSSSMVCFDNASVTLTRSGGSTAPVGLAENGGFETGDFTGWTLFPSAPGNISIGTPGLQSAFAGCIDNTVPASASLIKNANLGVGTVMPGEAITISFDAKGSSAVGGVVFAELFSELTGGGTSKSEILSGAPLALDPDPNTWKSFSFTTTTGPDVSGGVTLQLAAITGAATGSTSMVCFDNVSVTVMRPTSPATYINFGAGCAGTAGTPALVAPAPPWLGSTFQIELRNLPSNAIATLAIGLSQTQWGSLTLPADLGVIGMTGCTLYVSGEAFLSTTAVGSTATFSFPLTLPSLVGGTFYNQGFVLDAGANTTGVVASDAACGVVGLQ